MLLLVTIDMVDLILLKDHAMLLTSSRDVDFANGPGSHPNKKFLSFLNESEEEQELF